MRTAVPIVAFVFLALLTPVFAAEYNWEKLEGCTLVDTKWKDGDSFHVTSNGKEYIFRLYFVDTPEDENRFPDRVAEQAAYFGCTSERALELGAMAAEYTTELLKQKPFTVHTLWQDAMGASKQQRFYAIVETGKGNLAELLVSQGLARIYGKRITLPDGTDSRAYLEKLTALKEKALSQKLGGWGTSKLVPQASAPAPAPARTGVAAL